MSVEIMAVAWKHKGITEKLDRLVLLCLADYADEHGHCWPKIPTIAARCCCSEVAASQAVKRLEERGFISVKRYKGRGKNSDYWVHPEQIGADGLPLKPQAENPKELRVKQIKPKRANPFKGIKPQGEKGNELGGHIELSKVEPPIKEPLSGGGVNLQKLSQEAPPPQRVDCKNPLPFALCKVAGLPSEWNLLPERDRRELKKQMSYVLKQCEGDIDRATQETLEGFMLPSEGGHWPHKTRPKLSQITTNWQGQRDAVRAKQQTAITALVNPLHAQVAATQRKLAQEAVEAAERAKHSGRPLQSTYASRGHWTQRKADTVTA